MGRLGIEIMVDYATRLAAMIAMAGFPRSAMTREVLDHRAKMIRRNDSPRPEGSATEEQKAIGPKKRGKLPRSKRKK